MREVRVGDVGVPLTVQFMEDDCTTGEEAPADISANTILEISLERPDGTVQVFASPVFTPAGLCGTGTGSDGQATVYTTAASITLEGRYRYQGHVALPSSPPFDGRSEVIEFDATRAL